jgi:hypothetical protein
MLSRYCRLPFVFSTPSPQIARTWEAVNPNIPFMANANVQLVPFAKSYILYVIFEPIRRVAAFGGMSVRASFPKLEQVDMAIVA